jgi:GNAT superfamily N-acetyltransferase
MIGAMTTALPGLEIRLLRGDDSLEELTELLHRAYAALGALGFNYVAVDQDVATTRERIDGNECFVAAIGSRLVGTVLLMPPGRGSRKCDWYLGNVAVMGQFATEPSLQGTGIGSRLMDAAERRAAELGAAEIAMDTAEGATHLVELYQRRGYRLVGHVRWSHANYRSVVLSKRLGP